jgi:hypothetical protein
VHLATSWRYIISRIKYMILHLVLVLYCSSDVLCHIHGIMRKSLGCIMTSRFTNNVSDWRIIFGFLEI